MCTYDAMERLAHRTDLVVRRLSTSTTDGLHGAVTRRPLECIVV